ncbi:MAG: Nif3-like dinuclear metal center hexameric protein [Pirellulaceae bacterium]
MTPDPVSVDEVCRYLESYAPARLAEDWDNTGLLIGNMQGVVQQVMTCLTVTPETVKEAIDRQVQLIVTHHPLPFRPLKTITRSTIAGGMVLDLIEAGIAVYSPHTSFDSAAEGINQQLAEKLGLSKIVPLRPFDNDPDHLGAGRWGHLETAATLDQWVAKLCREFSISGLQIVAAPSATIQTVGIACGAAGSFLDAAISAGCDAFVTGETNFHTCLEAKAQQITLALPGHYASERFAVENLAQRLQETFPNIDVRPSIDETDPLRWVMPNVPQ